MKFTGERYGTFLPITEIARLTRAELKTLFPDWKFSVRTKKFSGGRSMDVSLQAGPESPFATLKVAPDPMFPDYPHPDHDGGYLQVNEIAVREVDGRWWHYRYELTEKGAEIIKEMARVANLWNRKDIEIQSDYFNVSYWVHLEIGQWDKPFERRM